MRSHKEQLLDAAILEKIKALGLTGKALDGAKLLLEDDEIHSVQEYANHVSIVRLGYNDHGPVHMRIVARNAVVILALLRKAGIKTNAESENAGGGSSLGDFEDSVIAVFMAALLHDLGMSLGRQDHEVHSTYLAAPIIDRVLLKLFPENVQKRTMIRSLALEGIYGHMGTRSIHSLEAGIVQVADGCDMTKGRARIPIALKPTPKVYLKCARVGALSKPQTLAKAPQIIVM